MSWPPFTHFFFLSENSLSLISNLFSICMFFPAHEVGPFCYEIIYLDYSSSITSSNIWAMHCATQASNGIAIPTYLIPSNMSPSVLSKLVFISPSSPPLPQRIITYTNSRFLPIQSVILRQKIPTCNEWKKIILFWLN